MAFPPETRLKHLPGTPIPPERNLPHAPGPQPVAGAERIDGHSGESLCPPRNARNTLIYLFRLTSTSISSEPVWKTFELAV